MYFKKLLIVVIISFIILNENPMCAMIANNTQIFTPNTKYSETCTETILYTLKLSFSVTKDTTNLERSSYQCKPLDNYDFSLLCYRLYMIGHNEAVQFYKDPFNDSIQKNRTLEKEIQELRKKKEKKIQELEEKICNLEGNLQTKNKEPRTLKNKQPYYKYFTHVGSSLFGAGIMILGIYAYSVFKK